MPMHKNLGYILLRNGRLRESFDVKIEWRWKQDKFLIKRKFLQPLWDGKQSLNGKNPSLV